MKEPLSPSECAPPRTDSHASRYRQSRELFARAQTIIPGGIHLSGRPLTDPETSPLYFERAKGCRCWDVDGNEYIDYLMAFGPFLLGYAHPEVEFAAEEQAKKGRLISLNHPLHLRFIEALLERFPGGEMGVFFRTGSEATTAALRIARRATGRRKVARAGYHGWHDWCLPLEDFVPAGLAEQVLEYDANDPASLERALGEAKGEVAAVILAPEMVMPHRPSIFHDLLRITQSHGAAFILDEVKTALRCAPNSIAERVGIVPDMMTLSKALGNGFPVAAVIGQKRFLSAGAGMHYSATYHGDSSAMAASLATLDLVARSHVQEHVDRLGRLLIAGLRKAAARHAVSAEAFGEPLPCMPFLRFTHPDRERNAQLSAVFYREMLAAGVLLHPRHMWFVSLAHTDADVSYTLAAADHAMKVAAKSLEGPASAQ